MTPSTTPPSTQRERDRIAELRWSLRYHGESALEALRGLDEEALRYSADRARLAERAIASDELAQRYLEEHPAGPRGHLGFGAWLLERFRAHDALVTSLLAPALEECVRAVAARREAEHRRAENAKRRERIRRVSAHVTRADFERVARSDEGTVRGLELAQVPDLTADDLERIATGRCVRTKPLDLVLAWARTAQPFLIVSGPVGVGKSFAGAAWLAGAGGGFYVRASDLALVRSRALAFSALEEPLHEVLSVSRLVVDELGLEEDAASERAAILELVSVRPNAKTLVLTNLLGRDVADRVGPRAWSRLAPLAGGVRELRGADMRRARKPPLASEADILADLEGLAEPLHRSERALLVRASGRGLDSLNEHERAAVERLLARGFTLDARSA